MQNRRGANKNRSNGPSVTTHVLIVNVGECITTRIMALSQDLGQSLCILSASGEISRVKLRLPSNAYVTYEGHFAIQTLGGSLLLFDGNGPLGRCGGVSVSFFGPNGYLIGGGVAGEMIAASSVQVVLLSFPGKLSNPSKEPNETGNSSAPPKVLVNDQSYI